jgi:tetratricopeptide (TPR) repeat protein
LDRAEKALTKGIILYPSDKRFPIELAGIKFKEKNYSRAIFWLRRALRIDGADAYANEFLATTYFLEGNLDAAIKYWNHVKKPQVESVGANPPPQVDPILLDHAFAFSPASTLRLAELWMTDARLQQLGIFPAYKIELMPKPDGKVDVSFNSLELNGWGSNKWQAMLLFFRGAFQQTVHPEWFNIHSSATNFVSLVRFDAQRRRAWASLSGPLRHDPKWHYDVALDLRNENWIIRSSPASPSVSGLFNLRKEQVSASVSSVPAWRWQWGSGLEIAHRALLHLPSSETSLPAFAPDTAQLKYFAQAEYQLARVPEHRFVMTVDARSETARLWSGSQDLFTKLLGRSRLHWLPQQRGSDYEFTARATYAKTFGDLPVDEQFILGLDPDSDLPLRGHIVTEEGRKGNSPVARSFLLTNAEADKIVYTNGLVTVKIAPFLDTAKVIDSDFVYQQQKWLFDLGVEAKITLFGVGFAVSYGKDLRSGTNAFYAAAR